MNSVKLSDYLSEERGRQAALARAIGAHAPDLSRWADGTRPIPIHFGPQIEKETGGAVTRQEMFPNWQLIWPELMDAAPAAVPSDEIPQRRATDIK